jgi:hypothetical protein
MDMKKPTIISVANDTELNLLRDKKEDIMEASVVIVEWPKPSKAYIYHNGKFIRLT